MAFLGTPFRLRENISRESVTPGFHGSVWAVSGHSGTPRDGIRPPRDSSGCFVRDLDTTGFVGIVCARSRQRDIPRDGIQPRRDKNGTICEGSGYRGTTRDAFVPDAAAKLFVLSRQCCIRRPQRWYHTCCFLRDPTPKGTPRLSYGAQTHLEHHH